MTGQKIDHFAEVNLAGFYYLAAAFGGIEACLKPSGGDENLYDANSGFNAVLDGYNKSKGGAQYLHLSAPQALAFVRERDNLPNGDLDRTHRQQAVLDYVIWKLENNGILSDLGQLTSLLSTAKQYLITDSTWNLLNFAPHMSALTGKNLQFYTAPIQAYATIDGQAANQIDIPTIQAAIKQKFTAPVPAAQPASTAKSGAKAAPSRRRRPSPLTSTTAAARRAWPPASRRRSSPRATRRAPSPTRRRSPGRRRAPRCSTGPARPPTRPRSLTTSARPPSRSRRWPPATSRCCSAPGPPWSLRPGPGAPLRSAPRLHLGR